MSTSSIRSRLWFVQLLAVAIVFCGLSAMRAEPKPKKKSAASMRSLEARVGKLEDNLLKEILDISGQYEDAGQYEKAKSLLEVLLKLNPEFPAVKERVDKLETKILDVHEVKFVLDTSQGWVSVGGTVATDKPVRFDVEGEYKFALSMSLTADGVPAVESESEFVGDIPCGALIGMVVADGKPAKPFPIKASTTWTPTAAGPLMIKINAPAGARCSGKLTVRMSGLAPLNEEAP